MSSHKLIPMTESERSPASNTDTEIWRGPDLGCGDYYADSLFMTKGGALGMNCSGNVIVKPIRDWFALANPKLKYDKDRRTIVAASPPAPPSPAGRGEFQSRVLTWMLECFGPNIPFDKTERNHRFLEEAIELVQSTGCTQSEAHQLVDYVFGRAKGDTFQEAGGVMTTLAALCIANKIDMQAAGEAELARNWTNIDKIRAKQAAKPSHSPLPAAPSSNGVGELAISPLDRERATSEAHDLTNEIFSAIHAASGWCGDIVPENYNAVHPIIAEFVAQVRADLPSSPPSNVMREALERLRKLTLEIKETANSGYQDRQKEQMHKWAAYLSANIDCIALPPAPVGGEDKIPENPVVGSEQWRPIETAPIEIRRKPTDGDIDEIIARNCSLVYVEQMSMDGWFMGINFPDGSYYQFWFGAKNRKSAVKIRHTEHTPPPSNDGPRSGEGK